MSGANFGNISAWGRNRGNMNCRSNYCRSSNTHVRSTLASGGGSDGCSNGSDDDRGVAAVGGVTTAAVAAGVGFGLGLDPLGGG